ncbi:hypothetical protein ACTFIR_002731 [Dictyostelium discoideum]
MSINFTRFTINDILKHCGRDDIKKIKVESHLSCCPKVNRLFTILKIERGEIENHITNDCCNTIVPCKYFEQGCNVLLKRSNLPNHLEDVNYQKFMAQLIESLTLQLRALNPIYPSFYNLKWIISNYKKEISYYKVLFSQSFYFENQEFLVVLKDFSYSYFQGGISISKQNGWLSFDDKLTIIILIEKLDQNKPVI